MVMKHFVFVVCGSREHTDTLNFSLKFLRRFSRARIHVLTDTSRNEAVIEHDRIIDVQTPDNLSHHQAAIFLKTSLHRYLEMKPGDLYCYLDSDVIAVSPKVDEIFNLKPEPVLFARDHCPLREFSPMAMNCNCQEEQENRNREFFSIINKLFPGNVFTESQTNKDKQKLEAAFEYMKEIKLQSWITAAVYGFKRYVLPVKTFRFAGFRFNKKNRYWLNSKNEIIHVDFAYHSKRVKDQSGIWLDPKTGRWYNAKNEDISPATPACEHLSEHIKNKYEHDIPGSWRHWNGGVFLFNQNSAEFLDYWHKITMEEFGDPASKTRDQGTLAVSAWHFGLQNMKTLPVRFNFITEHQNPDTMWDAEKGYTMNGFKTIFEPAFLHVYHHWGDESWDIWKSVMILAQEKERLQ
jgi:hypothetical protein